MGFAVRVLPGRRLGVIRLHGRVDGEGIIGAFRRLLLDAEWEPDFRALWDLRRVRTLLLLPEDVLRVAEATQLLQERMGPGRSAALARDEQDVMIVRLLSIRRRGNPERQLQAFVNRQEAATWLGVPVEWLDVA
jgi:hypothetical protein